MKVRLQWRGIPPEEAFDDPAYCARRYDNCADEGRAIHRPRYRVFKECLERDAEVDSGYEIDSFDALTPHWLLLCGFDGLVADCVRLLSSTVPMAHGSTKRRH
ncbi:MULTISPECIES: acyl-homoserine-lactone synthase [Mesorhizobium]|uniref:acyl-homoserine-lactone synthase n=1 Tax=Mesorhizobium TaxID=68287 RepID=UPI001315466E|nr:MULTISPECIES: acyl-homoserine-lactone synthase [Mesorhizobium]